MKLFKNSIFKFHKMMMVLNSIRMLVVIKIKNDFKKGLNLIFTFLFLLSLLDVLKN